MADQLLEQVREVAEGQIVSSIMRPQFLPASTELLA